MVLLDCGFLSSVLMLVPWKRNKAETVKLVSGP